MNNFLDSITIKGFKSIASVEDLKLRPINVLIGPNGCGKSNFIGAFALLGEVFDGRLKDYVVKSGGAERILHFGSKTTSEILFRFSFEPKPLEFRLRLVSVADDDLLPSESFAPGPRIVYLRVCHVHDTSWTSPMRKTAKVDDNRYLRPDGSNLAAFLYLLQERYPESYGLIRRTIQRVAPFFEDFRLSPLPLRPDDIKLEWRHRNSDQYFDVSSFSDGTLRFIALATLFLQPKELRPDLILVDEPELGLHPAAIELLGAMIRQVSAETQVIVATQSSQLVDQFQPEDILIANREKGATVFHREDPERLKTWLEDYSLGQLWEKNEIGGRPSRD